MNSVLNAKPTYHLTWIALMGVLQILFLLFQQFYPWVGYWFTFLLPIFTILVLLMTTWKGFLIYTFTSLMLIFVFIQPANETILFYWAPAFILGLSYVLGLKLKFTLFSMALFLSMTQLVILYLIRTVSLWLYEVDLVSFIHLFLNLTNVANIALLNPLMLYAMALLQTTMSLGFMLPLLQRFGIQLPYRLMLTKIEVSVFAGLFAFGVLFAWFVPSLSLYALGPLTLLSVYSYLYFFIHPVTFAAYPLLMGLVAYPFVNAFFTPIFEGPYRILSVLFIAIIPLALMMFKSFTQKKKNALI
jgi:hypothetical protein